MGSRDLKVLVLGGYGTFGSRVVEFLGTDASLKILVAGRSGDKAEAFCRSLETAATLVPLPMDRNGYFEATFREVRPDIIIDASGPFQDYGDRPYRVVEAAIDCGAHYIDLADASGFVRGITAYDYAARAAGVFVLSGASTCPALSGAVVRSLATQFSRIDDIRIGIAPSPHAPMSESVMRAIAGYAGRPLALRRHGCDVTAFALTESWRTTIRAPGGLPLRPRHFALVDVPDHALLAERYPELRSVRVGAGTEPAYLQRLLRLLARGVRFGLFRSLAPIASLMHLAARRLKRGEHRGGMVVELSGTSGNGTPNKASWHLVAEGDDGLTVPAMAAAALVARVRGGFAPRAGARTAFGELDLDDFEPFFRRKGIAHGVHESNGSESLYGQTLGNAWTELPESVREMHATDSRQVVTGQARVERGTGLLANLVAWVFGFPPAADDASLEVTFLRRNGRELWVRNFDGRIFSSTQFRGKGRNAGLIVERFGPLVFGLAPVVENGRMTVHVRTGSCFGLPLPRFLLPTGNTFEEERHGRFRFHVEVKVPLLGLLVRYDGTLAPRTLPSTPQILQVRAVTCSE